MSRMRIAAVLLLIGSSQGAWPQSGQHREVGAHVHGEADISLVVSGDELTVELQSPLFNILGFERAPATSSERATVATASTNLNSGLSIVIPAAPGQCRQTSAVAGLPPFESEAHDHHEDAHDDDDHDEDGGHHHADLTATYTFKCARIDQLGEVTVSAFHTFPGIRTADVVFLGPRTQTSRKLDASAPLFKLK